MAIFRVSSDTYFFSQIITVIKKYYNIRNNDFSDIHIILPNSRAVRFLHNSFARIKIEKLPTIQSILEYYSEAPNKLEQATIFAELYDKNNFLKGLKLYSKYYNILETLLEFNISKDILTTLKAEFFPEHIKHALKHIDFAVNTWPAHLTKINNPNLIMQLQNACVSIISDIENNKRIVICGFDKKIASFNNMLSYATSHNNSIVIEKVPSQKTFTSKAYMFDTKMAECEFIYKQLSSLEGKYIAIISESRDFRHQVFNYLKSCDMICDISDGLDIRCHPLTALFFDIAAIVSGDRSLIRILSILKSPCSIFTEHKVMIDSLYDYVTTSKQIFRQFEELYEIDGNLLKQKYPNFPDEYQILLQNFYTKITEYTDNTDNLIHTHQIIFQRLVNTQSELATELTILNLIQEYFNIKVPYIKPSDYLEFAELIMGSKNIYIHDYANHPNIRIMSLRESYLLNFDHIIFASCSEEEWNNTNYNPLFPDHIKAIFGINSKEANNKNIRYYLSLLKSSANHIFTMHKYSGGKILKPAEFIETSIEYVSITKIPTKKTNFPKEYYVDPEQKPKNLRVKDMEIYIENPFQFYLEKILNYQSFHGATSYGNSGEFNLTIRKLIYYILHNITSIKSLKSLLRSVDSIAYGTMNKEVYYYYKQRVRIVAYYLYNRSNQEIQKKSNMIVPFRSQINGIDISGDIDIVNFAENRITKFITSQLPTKKSIKEGEYLPIAFYLISQPNLPETLHIEVTRITGGLEPIETVELTIDTKTIEKSRIYIENIINKYINEPFKVDDNYYKTNREAKYKYEAGYN